MFPLRTSVALVLCCTVLVQAYSDYYRPMSKKGSPKSSVPKYAATMLSPPKLNRFYHRTSSKQYGGRSYAKARSQLNPHHYGGGIHDGVIGGHLIAIAAAGGGGKSSNGYPIKAGKIIAKIPIKSRHQLKFRHYPLKPGYGVRGIAQHELPAIVEVMAKSVPLSLVFRSSSSKINIQQTHDSTYAKQYGGPKHTYSIDEPHILKHSVTKPIIQEIREIIAPVRLIQQTVHPVQEEVVTHIATSAPQQHAPQLQPQQKAPLPAMYNAYQLEPVLYMTPDDIKSGAEYAKAGGHSLGGNGNVKVESYPGEVTPLVINQAYEQQQQPQLAQHYLEQQAVPQSVGHYEAVQQVSAPASAPVLHHADGVTQLATLSGSHAGQGLYSQEPVQIQQQQVISDASVHQAPAAPPVTLLADASLLDTYMKYASMSTQDVLLPVYQQTHSLPLQQQQQASYAPVEQHLPQLQEIQLQPQQQLQLSSAAAAAPLEHSIGGGGGLQQITAEAYGAPLSEALVHQDLQRITPIAAAHPETGKAY